MVSFPFIWHQEAINWKRNNFLWSYWYSELESLFKIKEVKKKVVQKALRLTGPKTEVVYIYLKDEHNVRQNLSFALYTCPAKENDLGLQSDGKDNPIINIILLLTILYCLSTMLTAGVSFLIAIIPNRHGKTRQLTFRKHYQQPHHTDGTQ